MSWNMIKGESIRQRTTIAPWLILLAGVAICVLMPLMTGYNVAAQYIEDGPAGAPAFVHDYVFSFAGRTGYFAPLLLGVLAVVTDVRDGAMSKLVTYGRGRGPALVAKTAVVVAGALLIGALMITANVLAGWVGLRSGFATASGLLGWDTLTMAASTLALYPLWALIGLGLGMLLRSQVLAIVLVFAFVLFVEPILTVLSNENATFSTVGKFMPGALNWAVVWPAPPSGAAGPVVEGALSPLPVLAALLCLALYGAVTYGAGAVVGVLRRELPM